MSEEMKNIKEAFPNVDTLNEVAKTLGWKTEKRETKTHFFCCGKEVEYGGWIGVEHLNCQVCNKGVQNVFSPIPVSNSAVNILDSEEFTGWENGEMWIPERFWGNAVNHP